DGDHVPRGEPADDDRIGPGAGLDVHAVGGDAAVDVGQGQVVGPLAEIDVHVAVEDPVGEPAAVDQGAVEALDANRAVGQARHLNLVVGGVAGDVQVTGAAGHGHGHGYGRGVTGFEGFDAQTSVLRLHGWSFRGM